MSRLRPVATALPGGGAIRYAKHGRPASGTSVPYFEFSVKGHLTDSARGHPTGRVAHEEPRHDYDMLLGADPAVPYFELSLPGSVRVYQDTDPLHTPALL